MENNQLNKVKKKIRMSLSCSNLLAMEEDFNKIGLTIQTTTKNRIILCKIKDEQPYCREICEDYIFIGSYDGGDQILSDRVIDTLVEFVDNAHSKPAKVVDKMRSWQRNVSMYGKVILVNEDVHALSQEIID